MKPVGIKGLSLFLALFVLLPILPIAAEEQDEEFDDIFSEEDIFSDEGEIIIEEEEKEEIIDESVSEELEQESVTFSGEIDSLFSYTFTRDFLKGDQHIKDNTYAALVSCDLMLDIRFRRGIKAFADLFVGYTPTEMPSERRYTALDPTLQINDDIFIEKINTLITLKEFFIDINIRRYVYFRVGKQVLKWGRGYLWNPTDFINVEKKAFSDVEARREGIYGLKMHIAAGTTFNLYGFINAVDPTDITGFAFAGKLEFLVKNVEFSVSGWGRKNKFPMFGFDISGSLFGIELWGEAAFSYGYNTPKLTTDGEEYRIRNEFFTWFCLGFRKSIDIGDVTDRFTITGEFFYNHGGYRDNMFDTDPATRFTFLEGGYYQAAYYGKIYASLFLNVKKFLASNMELNISFMGNFSDFSFILITGIAYNIVYNVNFTFDIYSCFGKEKREFTYDGSAITLEIGLTLRF
jgi:hypothetical protein